MVGGAILMLSATGTSLQDTSIQLTSLLGGGMLGIYLIGFLTRRGDARSVWCGIGATALFTVWTLGWLPERVSVPFDRYYTAAFGNLVMFVMGYAASLAWPRKTSLERDLSLAAER